MSDDRQPQDPAAPAPTRGWGGENESEATAYLELPQGSGAVPGAAGDENDPLAAPGSGYQPPALGEGPPLTAASGTASGTPPVTAPATTDPGATGQWTMPFAHGGAASQSADSQAAASQTAGGAAAMGQAAAALARGGQDHPAPWPAPPPEPEAPAGEHEDGQQGEPLGEPEPTAASSSDHPELSYVLRVNGTDRPVSGAWIGESLLYVLRERLGLAGAKDGCSQGECGTCSVQVDGRLVAACLVPAATAAGSEIRTVEGLTQEDGTLSDVQRALAGIPVQCGFCLPGMAMTVHDLLEGNHSPTELEMRQALSGNLCRCSGYQGVLQAVRAVVEERAKAARAAEEAAAGDQAAASGEPGTGPAPGGDTAGRIPHQAGPPAGGMS